MKKYIITITKCLILLRFDQFYDIIYTIYYLWNSFIFGQKLSNIMKIIFVKNLKKRKNKFDMNMKFVKYIKQNCYKI